MSTSPNWALELLERFLKEGVLGREDVEHLLNTPPDLCDPETIRRDLEVWFRNAGIEHYLGHPFKLSACPFTHDELLQLQAKNFIVLCVPAQASAAMLAKAFHFESWAVTDELVTLNIPREDDWFATPATSEPPHQGTSARKATLFLEEQDLHGLTLQRYLVFLARMRTLNESFPDVRWWTWLLRTHYDRSGVLIAGLDQKKRLSVHAWMKNFSAKFVGVRYCTLPSVPPGASRDTSR